MLGRKEQNKGRGLLGERAGVALCTVGGGWGSGKASLLRWCISHLGLPQVGENHRLGHLHNRNVFPPCSGVSKSKVRLFAGLVYNKASLPGV